MLSFVKGSKTLRVVILEDLDEILLINRLKCQIRKHQFCIYCSACDAICEQLAISTLGNEYK